MEVLCLVRGIFQFPGQQRGVLLLVHYLTKQICNPHWLTCALYMLKENELIGTVGFPLIHINPETGGLFEEIDPAKWGTRPGRVGAAVGCCFGFRKRYWEQIKQIDGSIGFPEYFGSFHEEIDLGMEFAKRGWRSYMMHYPATEHWRSRTFSLNPELAWYLFDDRYADRDEYNRVLATSKYAKAFWDYQKDRIDGQFITSDGRIDRMSYSRYLFMKKWGVQPENYDDPMNHVHRMVVDVLEPIQVKWLDEQLNPQEGIIP